MSVNGDKINEWPLDLARVSVLHTVVAEDRLNNKVIRTAARPTHLPHKGVGVQLWGEEKYQNACLCGTWDMAFQGLGW